MLLYGMLTVSFYIENVVNDIGACFAPKQNTTKAQQVCVSAW